MPYGELTPEMEAVLRPMVKDRLVWDLGAGDGGRAKWLARAGARVVAVDKEPVRVRHPRIRVVTSCFLGADLGEPPDLALLAWPANYTLQGLIDLLEKAPLVAYLGCNDGMTACGWPPLYAYLRTRGLVAHIEHPKNTLLVVGESLSEPREATPEETGGVWPGWGNAGAWR